MFNGEKTWVFWVGLIIFALACTELFSVLWWLANTSPYASEIALKNYTPFIVGGIVFFLVGLFMMKEGYSSPNWK